MHTISQVIPSILTKFAAAYAVALPFTVRLLSRAVKTATHDFLSCFSLCGLSTCPGVCNRASYACTPGSFLQERNDEN